MNTSQSAFPRRNNGPDSEDDGMSLRDYFAAKALAAMIANPNKVGNNSGANGVFSLPRFAYEYADAMMEARKWADSNGPDRSGTS